MQLYIIEVLVYQGSNVKDAISYLFCARNDAEAVGLATLHTRKSYPAKDNYSLMMKNVVELEPTFQVGQRTFRWEQVGGPELEA